LAAERDHHLKGFFGPLKKKEERRGGGEGTSLPDGSSKGASCLKSRSGGRGLLGILRNEKKRRITSKKIPLLRTPGEVPLFSPSALRLPS